MKVSLVKITVFFAFAVPLFLPGCVKEDDPPPPPPVGQRNEASLHGMVKQERTKIQNDFKNLGLFYLQYQVDFGRSPAKWEKFKSYIQSGGDRAPTSLVKGIEEGRYVVIWNAELSSNKVLAYEKQPDVKGYQVVLFGDGHIETIKSEELQKALEAKN
jgi:hypothetical protein